MQGSISSALGQIKPVPDGKQKPQCVSCSALPTGALCGWLHAPAAEPKANCTGCPAGGGGTRSPSIQQTSATYRLFHKPSDRTSEAAPGFLPVLPHSSSTAFPKEAPGPAKSSLSQTTLNTFLHKAFSHLAAEKLSISFDVTHSVQLSCSIASDSLRPHRLQHTRLPCPSPTLRGYSNSCPLSR